MDHQVTIGRVVWQKWAIPSDPEVVLDRYFYGYDRNSNRLWRAERQNAAVASGRDEAYYYDGLNRLVQAKRGILPVKDGNGEGQAPYPGDANGDGKVDSLDIGILRINWDPTGASDKTWARSDFNGDGKVDSLDEAILRLNWNATGYSEVLNRASAWSLDALGNWAEYKEDDDSTLDWDVLDQAREHNPVNEIYDATYGSAITEDHGLSWIDPIHDAAGNMILAPRPGNEATAAQALVLKYDAWNRVAAVYADTDADHDGVPDGGDTLIATYRYDGQNRRIQKILAGDPEVTYDYYYSGHQVVEVRKDADADPLEQYVWDIRYVHAPVLRWRDTNTDGTLEDTLYYCNDANFNVTALVDASDGSVVERVMYDPYGKPTFYDGTWAKTQLDQETPGTLSAYANAVLFTGHRLDDETGLYVTLYRYYHPTLGRWLSRDPIGYLGVVSLYHYLDADPVGVTDSFGLAASSSTDWTKRLPDLRVGETLKLDYSTKGWAEEQMGTEAEAAVKAQFPAADYPNTKIHIGNSIANLVQNENAAGTSGFMVGWSFEVGVVTSPTPDRFGATCHCGFQGTMWKFLAYVVVKDNQNGSYVYIRSSRSDVTGVVSPDRSTGFLYSDTMEHESWHTDGVPDEVRKKASDLGITIDKPGYRGQAKAERGAAMAAFAALVMENRDVTTNEVNTAPTREWCKEKGEAIMERHLTGDDAILRVLNAGLYHTGLTRHRPNYYFAPVPQER